MRRTPKGCGAFSFVAAGVSDERPVLFQVAAGSDETGQ